MWVKLFALSLVFATTVHAQVVVTALDDVVVTTTATLVAADDGSRYALSCTNTHGSIHVRWGGPNVTTTRGQQLKAGHSIEILSRGKIYMAAESSSVTVSCTKETR